MRFFVMFRTMLEFRSAMKESSNLVLFSRIRGVLMENSPTKPLERLSNEPNNFELELLVSFAFKISQDSLDSSPMMTSTVSRIFCRSEDRSL